MLISFEGIDGCGKSTQIELLKNYFDDAGTAHSVFREPGGTKISEKIRELLLHEPGGMDSVTELLLFSAARSQLITEKIVPLLKQGVTVILDRFYDSTTAYQGYGRNSAGIESIQLLNRLASHQTVPDVTFYLRIDPLEAAKRIRNTQKDRMESSGPEFYKKVCEGYDLISRQEKRFVTLDALQPPETIHEQIVSFLAKSEK